MDVSSIDAVNAYLLQDRRQARTPAPPPAPPEALVDSIKDSVKQQDRTLGDEGARMVASHIAARHVDVRV